LLNTVREKKEKNPPQKYLKKLKAHHDVEVAELEPGLLVRHEDLQILGQLIDGLSVVPLAPIDAKKINRFLSLFCGHKCLKGTSNLDRKNGQDVVMNFAN
jgi:hypothetical protein